MDPGDLLGQECHATICYTNDLLKFDESFLVVVVEEPVNGTFPMGCCVMEALKGLNVIIHLPDWTLA